MKKVDRQIFFSNYLRKHAFARTAKGKLMPTASRENPKGLKGMKAVLKKKSKSFLSDTVMVKTVKGYGDRSLPLTSLPTGFHIAVLKSGANSSTRKVML